VISFCRAKLELLFRAELEILLSCSTWTPVFGSNLNSFFGRIHKCLSKKTTPKKWPEPAPSSITIIRHTLQISLFMQWILQNPLDYVTAMRSTSFWFRVTFLGLLFWYDFIAFEHAPLFTLLDLNSCFRAGLELVFSGRTWIR